MRIGKDIEDRIYAGLLGKAIGVYLGRPVEGWPYEDIISRYGELDWYVNKDQGIPLIVADDDLSGTSTFFRAMEDNGFSPDITAEDIGRTWLNYIIEDRTILWWGGIGNSTEHTAYLRLKSGVKAPESGSIALNGKVMATQVGSQIFMEEYALMCPGDPERAVSFVDRAVSVSHDGIAREGACFLAAMEALAFIERDLLKIFSECRRFIHSDELKALVDYVQDVTAKYTEWRDVRDAVGKLYGYDRYLGPAPFETNHAMVLAGILAGGDDFAKSVMIGASAGWDTDCNAGNIGCFNGIRLGLDGITAGPDLITPVADRLIVVSADGGECFTDLVRETRKVVAAAAALSGGKAEEKPRFMFEYRESLHGFQPCPYAADNHAETADVSNPDGKGLVISFRSLAKGTPFSISTPTFFDLRENYNAYEMYGSPSLYETQRVDYTIASDDESVSVRPFIWYSDSNNSLKQVFGPYNALGNGTSSFSWQLPELGGMPVLRFGFEFSSVYRSSSFLRIMSVDWADTPEKIEQRGIMMKDMWDLSPFWAKAFVPSSKVFTPNLKHTYCISHPEENGVSTIGTRDFHDYSVESNLSFSLHESGGLVARARGHRRYYAAILAGGTEALIIKRIDDEVVCLAKTDFVYSQFDPLNTVFTVKGNELELSIGGRKLLSAADDDPRLRSGAAGFVVSRGSMFIDDFILRRV